eukprot:1161473-Pelagomonas_calceolata.AAC.3
MGAYSFRASLEDLSIQLYENELDHQGGWSGLPNQACHWQVFTTIFSSIQVPALQISADRKTFLSAMLLHQMGETDLSRKSLAIYIVPLSVSCCVKSRRAMHIPVVQNSIDCCPRIPLIKRHSIH